jgi:peptidoglycan hydrolase CwlO-like protein
MWGDAKQLRLNELPRRAERAPLSVDDQRALDELLHDLEEMEWAALRPALHRLRHEQQALATDVSQLQAQNTEVAALAGRYADLLARAKAQLAQLTTEREVLRREYERAVH